jgi:hypothetical protein
LCVGFTFLHINVDECFTLSILLFVIELVISAEQLLLPEKLVLARHCQGLVFLRHL